MLTTQYGQNTESCHAPFSSFVKESTKAELVRRFVFVLSATLRFVVVVVVVVEEGESMSVLGSVFMLSWNFLGDLLLRENSEYQSSPP